MHLKLLTAKIYPITAGEDEKLQEFIDEQRAKGYIHPSKSPYASPFFFVKKKDGKLRPVQDYQKLNEYTIKDKYLLPLIPEHIAKVQDAWIFSKFDIRWGIIMYTSKGMNTKWPSKPNMAFSNP